MTKQEATERFNNCTQHWAKFFINMPRASKFDLIRLSRIEEEPEVESVSVLLPRDVADDLIKQNVDETYFVCMFRTNSLRAHPVSVGELLVRIARIAEDELSEAALKMVMAP
jgi:hypothetical protein